MLQREEKEGVLRFRVAKEIWGKGRYFTACYWVDSLMVDTGCAHTAHELDAALEGRSVGLIVNTHGHEDHFGGNACITRKHGARVLAHPRCLEIMASPRRELRMQLYRHVFWGTPEVSEGAPIGAEVHTPNHRFEVIHTPGHCTEHVVLFEPERGWLFTGDAFVGGRDRALRGEADIWQIIASMRVLARLDARLMFVGSGKIYDRPREQLEQKIAYLEDAGERVLHLHERGLPLWQIHRKVFGRQPFLAHLTGGDFAGKHLVASFLRGRRGR